MQTTQRFQIRVRNRSRVRVTPLTLGVVGGALAVGLEAFFTVRPPSAYGICIACHGRDLVNSTVNFFASTSLSVAQASLAFPLLTVIGVFLGALVAALVHGEFRWHLPDLPVRNFAWGFLVMNFALLAAGCSIRLVLRAAHGEALGLISFGAMAAGIAAATTLMKWRALR
ncbi:MAG: YeeE/YedE thiosulfate transporter family protein [Dehalococcoidia bacterium]